MRFVLDASVAVKWFVPEPFSPDARALLPPLQTGELQLIAPDVVVAEFGHAIRHSVLGKKLDAAEAPSVIRDFIALDVPRVAAPALAEEAMRLTMAHMSTFYDGLYMALAVREGLKVLTADERMTAAFSKLARTLHIADFKPP